ncbi:MAG: hypothetical protein JXQ73_04645 [Phycisphaerae bacterium]|nr:hypothetical protein [Phycisphaerae bacterium]
MQERAPIPSVRSASVALFLLAGAVLVLEVALTRVLSVMAWHHFAYVIISLALLGFGAASSYLTIAKRFWGGQFHERVVARYALGFCASTFAALALATKIELQSGAGPDDGLQQMAVRLLLLYLLFGIPFFFAGVCIGYLISRAGAAIHRLYFADLLGAGTGALLSIAGINHLGVESTIYGAGLAGAVVSVVYADRRGGRLVWGASRLAVVGALVVGVLATRREFFPVLIPPDKFPRALTMPPHDTRWHVVARVDVLSPFNILSGFGGQLSPNCDPKLRNVPIRVVLQDGTAPTGIVSVPDGDVGKVTALDYYLQGAPYVVKPRPDDALIIGVGGGIDVLIALRHGARRIEGVEINPVVVDAVKRRHADFAGRIFDRPDVHLVTSEGRHYLTTTDKRFDVIQLSGVDTFTAVSTGAYALSESYLYTVEAMYDYWRCMKEGAVLSFSRFLLTPPRETLRLVAIQMEAMRRLGVDEPYRHMMVVAGVPEEHRSWAETLLKKTPLTAEEVNACRQWAARLGFSILHDPFTARENPFHDLIRADASKRDEIIETYPYNISPISDNDPFFFQYQRWRTLLPGGTSGQKSGKGKFDLLPMALVFLLFSMIQILALSGLFILGPLVVRRRTMRQTRGKARVWVFFGCLGLGFITVEITLLQKYTVFVGGPVYAMAVTLFAILVFSGLGSLLAGRIARATPRMLAFVLPALAAAVVAEVGFADNVMPKLMFLGHASRCAVTVLALAPLAMLMGMPFPTGIRIADRLGPSLVAWAWGINAVATTFGALLCVLVSMGWGFTATLYGGAAMYLVAMAIRLERLAPAPPGPSVAADLLEEAAVT